MTRRSCGAPPAVGRRAGLALVVVVVGCLGVVPATAAAATYGPQQTLPFTACIPYDMTTNCLTDPYGVAVDPSGDVIVLNSYNNQVVELTQGADGSLSDGTVTTLPFTGLNYPTGVAVDASGDVFVADSDSNRVVELSPGADGKLSDGTQTTLPFVGCTPQSSANCLVDPTGVAVDASGNVFVVSGNSEILELLRDTQGFYGQAKLPFVGLNGPQGVAVDASGNVFVTDFGADTPGGRWLIELSPGADGWSDGTEASYATNYPPFGVGVDAAGNVYVTVQGSESDNAVEEFSPGPDGKLVDGTVQTLPFTGLEGFSGSYGAQGVAVDAEGDVFLANTLNDQIVVLPSVVAKLNIGPAGQTVAPGATADFSAEGFDASDKDLGDETAHTRFSITPDGSGSAKGASCLANGCLATVAGTYTVAGRDGLGSGSTTMTVVAGMPRSLKLSPVMTTVTPGTAQAYQAEGFDASGDDAGDVTADTSFSITAILGTGSDVGASCNGNVCSATVPGTYSVTADDNDARLATGEAELVVAPITSLSLSPDASTVVAGDAQTYSAEGLDALSVDLGSVTGSTKFSIAPDGSGSQTGASCTGDVCSASAPGAYTVTGTYTAPGTDAISTGTATLTVTVAGTSAGVLEINEVRFTGMAPDPSDVYVELYNSSSAPVSISGWSVGWEMASGVTGSTRLADSSLAGGVIPAGGHYLLADDASYSLPTVPDQDLGLPSGSGGLVGADIVESGGLVSDSVGYVGTAYASVTGLTKPEYPTYAESQFQITFVRRFTDGQPVNTGDNASDFDLVAPDAGGSSYGETTVLGVPSPLNSTSPIQVNGIAQSYLLDTGAGEDAAPNLEFDSDGQPASPVNPAILIIRRTIKNVSTSSTITALQIRITGLSTYGKQSDPVFGDPSSPSSVAILDNTSAPGGTVSTSSGQATIAATTLQSPVPSYPNYSGGINSVLTVALPLETGSSTQYGLIPGQSVNVAIEFYVLNTGSFKLAYNVEDDLKPYTPATTQVAGSPVSTGASGTPVAASLSGSVTQTGVKLAASPVTPSKGTVHRKKHKTHKKRKTRKPAHQHRRHKNRKRAHRHR